MQITLTAHARQRSTRRGVPLDMIVDTIEQPNRTATGYRRRHLAYKDYGDRGTLKVVYAQEDESVTVITVIWE